MNDDQQHPPMNGDEELAKTLDGGLQFEETPAPGMDAPTMSSAPGAMGDPLAGMPTPTLPGDEPKQDEPSPTVIEPPKDDTKDDADLPAVHHSHADTVHMGSGDKDDEPTDVVPPVIAPVHQEADEHTHDKKSHAGGLDKIKESALSELKPLVGKLNLQADEKFDTLLLIIRSTDDQALLDEAYEAAKDITDESKRAQALLDIIKEVDYFSSKH